MANLYVRTVPAGHGGPPGPLGCPGDQRLEQPEEIGRERGREGDENALHSWGIQWMVISRPGVIWSASRAGIEVPPRARGTHIGADRISDRGDVTGD